MKIALYRKQGVAGGLDLYFASPDEFQEHKDKTFIGYVELNVEKPKRTVTENAVRVWRESTPYGVDKVLFNVPFNAKNVKCTYETEEEIA